MTTVTAKTLNDHLVANPKAFHLSAARAFEGLEKDLSFTMGLSGTVAQVRRFAATCSMINALDEDDQVLKRAKLAKELIQQVIDLIEEED